MSKHKIIIAHEVAYSKLLKSYEESIGQEFRGDHRLRGSNSIDETVALLRLSAYLDIPILCTNAAEYNEKTRIADELADTYFTLAKPYICTVEDMRPEHMFSHVLVDETWRFFSTSVLRDYYFIGWRSKKSHAIKVKDAKEYIKWEPC